MLTKQTITKRILTLGTMFLVAGMVSFASVDLLNHNAFAETFESAQGISFTFNPTVKITITGGTGATSSGLTIDNLTPGDYKDSNIITVTAGSNSPLGYTLSSTVGSSTYNSTELRRGGTETANIFTNLSSNKASLSAFDPGYWGYSYSTDSGSTWISGDIVSGTSAGYNGLPIYTSSSPIKLINSSTPSSSSIQFKIGARATSSQLAGTYSNVVNFIGVAKVVTTTYTINYNANAGSDTVTNMPTPNPLTDTDTTGNAAIKISSNVPVKTNYMFKGWCTSQTSDDTCSSDVVQPGGYVALNPGTSSPTANVTKNLYAMWKSNSAGPTDYCTTLAAQYCMQNVSTWGSSLTTNAQVQAMDSRDGKVYYVAKLSNGEIWMTQNLDHDISSSYSYSSANTDVSNTPTLTSTYATGSTTWNLSTTAPESYDPGDLCWKGTFRSDWSGTLDDSTVSCSMPDHRHIGNYYNWTAAVAMENSSSYTQDQYDVNQSICPAGWRLPTYSGSKSYLNLKNTLSLTAGTSGNIHQTPVYFVYGGYWAGSSDNVGSYGVYWSSVVKNSTYAYDLYLDVDGYLIPQGSDYRYLGNSVRCVAR